MPLSSVLPFMCKLFLIDDGQEAMRKDYNSTDTFMDAVNAASSAAGQGVVACVFCCTSRFDLACGALKDLCKAS